MQVYICLPHSSPRIPLLLPLYPLLSSAPSLSSPPLPPYSSPLLRFPPSSPPLPYPFASPSLSSSPIPSPLLPDSMRQSKGFLQRIMQRKFLLFLTLPSPPSIFFSLLKETYAQSAGLTTSLLYNRLSV